MNDTGRLLLGECLEVLKTLPDNSIDAVCTDPPYGLSFMGHGWDYDIPPVDVWRECLRVAKPGTHLLSFGGTRTYHRMACSIEDAGWQVRDMLQWLHAQGFPKSHNLTGTASRWGTSLKPSQEPILLARKPLEGTVAGNVQTYGTGALAIDASKIGKDAVKLRRWTDAAKPFGGNAGNPYHTIESVGRWPSNVLLSHSPACADSQCVPDCPVAMLGDKSRFFYCAKCSPKEREAGLEAFPEKPFECLAGNADGQLNTRSKTPNRPTTHRNYHPTVKPISLMVYLCGLITPPAGTILDPFMGSGTTGIAAYKGGFDFVGIEREPDYLEIAVQRIAHWRYHV